MPCVSPVVTGSRGPCAVRKKTARSPGAKLGAPGITFRYRPTCPPGTVNAIDSPALPFMPRRISTVTTLSMKRRSAVHCARTSATRPYTTDCDALTSCSKLSGTTVVASAARLKSVMKKTARRLRHIRRVYDIENRLRGAIARAWPAELLSHVVERGDHLDSIRLIGEDADGLARH